MSNGFFINKCMKTLILLILTLLLIGCDGYEVEIKTPFPVSEPVVEELTINKEDLDELTESVNAKIKPVKIKVKKELTDRDKICPRCKGQMKVKES